MEKAKVYFTKEITPDSLIRIYEKLGVASLAPVAVDQACIDMIWNSKDPGAEELKERGGYL